MAAKKKLLVTGISGLLGNNLGREYRDRYEVLGTYHGLAWSLPGIQTARLDITSEADVRRLVLEFKPGVVIHCAAETRVDYCEEHPDAALAVNAAGAGAVARAAAGVRAPVVHISTDAVYPGLAGPYGEGDPTGPVNMYARSKLRGEQEVAAANPEHLILRTNIFGWNARPKASLAEWVLDGLRRGGGAVAGFTDIIFSPLLVNDLAGPLMALLEHGARGVYNAGGPDRISKHQFALLLAEAFGFGPERIREALSGEANFRAPRPRDTSLDSSRAMRMVGPGLFPTVRQGLERFRRLVGQDQPG
jgi:dTDP-4-dehydrorhamnose reductase